MPAAAGLAALLLCSLGAHAAGPLKIEKIERELDLRTTVVAVREVYTFNGAPDAAAVCVPADIEDRVVALTFFHQGADAPLTARPSSAGAGNSAACYDVQLGRKSAPLVATYSVVHAQVPHPPSMPQDGVQILTFSPPLHTPSPYAVAAQALTVTLPTAEVFEYDRPAGAKTKLVGETLTVRDIPAAAPFAAAAPIFLRYRSNAQCVHFVSVDRSITVSHWGRVYIEERYTLRNAGTAVNPPISRWALTSEFMTGAFATSPHIRLLPFSLPKSAQFVYTKDDLGETQHMPPPARDSDRVLRMTAIPRYPLLGGWQTELVLGYSVPLPAAVLRRGRRHTLVFLVPPLLDTDYVADVVTTRVILPEGSTDVYVTPTLLPLTEAADSRTFSFLDTFLGRPTKTVTARLVTRAMLAAPVEVQYAFNPAFAALEPALLVAAFFAAFLALIAISRLDWTLAKDDRWHAARAQRAAKTMDGRIAAAAAEARLHLAAVQADEGATAAGKQRAVAAARSLSQLVKSLQQDTEGASAAQQRKVRDLCEPCAKVAADVQARGGAQRKAAGGVPGMDYALLAAADILR